MKRSTFVAATAAAIAILPAIEDNRVLVEYGPWKKDGAGYGATRVIRAWVHGSDKNMYAFQKVNAGRVFESTSIIARMTGKYAQFPVWEVPGNHRNADYREKIITHPPTDPLEAHQECVAEAEKSIRDHLKRDAQFHWSACPGLRMGSAFA